MTQASNTRWSAVFAACSFALLSWGCSGSGSGLAGAQLGLSKCPPNGCAGLEPDENQLSLTSPGPLVAKPIYLAGGTLYNSESIEIAGDCYASTFPSNRIEVKMYYGSSEVALSSNDISPTVGTTNEIKCIQGRYGFSILGTKFTIGQQYRINARMIAYDSLGNEATNASTGAFDITVQRPQPVTTTTLAP